MSFGLSHGRKLDPGEHGITREQLPPHDAGDFDPRTLFNRPDHRLEIEIGSGKGTFLAQQASLEPGTNFLGIEWTGEFQRYAADRVRRHGLENVRVLHDDASEFIRYWCPAGIVDVIHLYFSDPWPKSRHHKRRVIQTESLVQFHRVLVPGGLVHVVTDHDQLWDWCVDHVDAASGLFMKLEFQPPGSAGEGEIIGTNFERKYRREGRPFHAMTLRKKPDAT
ncbi:MAG: tRNA (guanosine(46)-N7)-methyltransferase TrmB [Phycisphaerae bacterium]|nr:tRNA (guanosine(46)-N7)-methyltransferase TrmB [Phycisphaerae bacterium]